MAKATTASKTAPAPKTGGIHKPVKPSADLAAIVGTDDHPPSAIVSKILV